MELLTLARPYANAIFAVALEQGHVVEYHHVLQQLACAVRVDAYRQLMGNPHVSIETLVSLLKVTDALQAEYWHNFLTLLATNKRLQLLPQILSWFSQKKARHENTLTVSLGSAFPMTADQQAQMSALLERLFQSQVALQVYEDNTLIGGVIIKAGDQVIDGSVKKQLEQMAERLMH